MFAPALQLLSMSCIVPVLAQAQAVERYRSPVTPLSSPEEARTPSRFQPAVTFRLTLLSLTF